MQYDCRPLMATALSFAREQSWPFTVPKRNVLPTAACVVYRHTAHE